MQTPPPPEVGPPRSGGTAVIVVFGLLGLLMMLALVGAGVAAFLRTRSSGSSSASRSTSTSAFPESYAMKNGLVVLHYPSDFAAKSLDSATVILTRHLGDGSDEMLQVAAVPHPISDEVGEFSRLLLVAMTKNIEKAGDTWTETSRAPGPCFRAYPGLLVEGTFKANRLVSERVRACFFMDHDRGYEVKTVVPASHVAEELPLLQSIANATEIH